MGDNANAIFEFRCRNHIVRMYRTNGAYRICVTCTGTKLLTGETVADQSYDVADVVDRDLAVHCFNHTVQQYQKDAE